MALFCRGERGRTCYHTQEIPACSLFELQVIYHWPTIFCLLCFHGYVQKLTGPPQCQWNCQSSPHPYQLILSHGWMHNCLWMFFDVFKYLMWLNIFCHGDVRNTQRQSVTHDNTGWLKRAHTHTHTRVNVYLDELPTLPRLLLRSLVTQRITHKHRGKLYFIEGTESVSWKGSHSHLYMILWGCLEWR